MGGIEHEIHHIGCRLSTARAVILALLAIHYSKLCCILGQDAEGEGLPQLSADGQALIDFQRAADLNHALDGMWAGSDPCTSKWTGVSCDELNRVTKVKLEMIGLTGTIAPNTLSRLSNLHVLSLKDNSLTGQIPSDLSLCTNLWQIYLNNNRFTGSIPDIFYTINRLHRLYLANNSLEGEIPSSLAALTTLYSLRLEGNNLTGTVPDIGGSNLTEFSVANNNLSGEIPPSLLSDMYGSSSFEGNHNLCGAPLLADCSSKASAHTEQILTGGSQRRSKPKKHLTTLAIVWISLADVLLVVVLTLAFLLYYKNKYPPDKLQQQQQQPYCVKIAPDELALISRVRVSSSLEELLGATAETIGKGSMGGSSSTTTYKVQLGNGRMVAVKRVVEKSELMRSPEMEQRLAAVVMESMLHPNLVPLLACHNYLNHEKLLVYEYMPNGSLHDRLHAATAPGNIEKNVRRLAPLSWDERKEIAYGVCKGLAYLHEAKELCKVPHGGINSSNILLDIHCMARISDISPFWSADIEVKWRSGYAAPECNKDKQITQKTDVYSYGVLLLEIVTGKIPASHGQDLNTSDGIDLVVWINSFPKNDQKLTLDPCIISYCSIEEENEMLSFMEIALKCCLQQAKKRPKMAIVQAIIEQIIARHHPMHS